LKSHLVDRSLPTNGLNDVLIQRLIKDLLFQRLKEAEKCTTAVAHEIQAPLLIGDVVGKSATLLNGAYEPTRDVHYGKPVFQKQGDRDMWLRFNSSNIWEISREIDGAPVHYSCFSIPSRPDHRCGGHERKARLTIKLDRLMIVSNQAFSAGFCMYH
jgi:hypothetical protein